MDAKKSRSSSQDFGGDGERVPLSGTPPPPSKIGLTRRKSYLLLAKTTSTDQAEDKESDESKQANSFELMLTGIALLVVQFVFVGLFALTSPGSELSGNYTTKDFSAGYNVFSGVLIMMFVGFG